MVQGSFLCSSTSSWSTPFVENAVFSLSELLLHLCQISVGHICVVLFWVLSHWFVYPSLHHTFLTRVVIAKVLKLGRLIPLALFFFRIRRFRIILPMSAKNLAVIYIGIALHLYIDLGRIDHFTVLSLLRHEHSMSFRVFKSLISFISIMYLQPTCLHLPRSRGSRDES